MYLPGYLTTIIFKTEIIIILFQFCMSSFQDRQLLTKIFFFSLLCRVKVLSLPLILT